MLGHLEELAHKLGIQVRYEPLEDEMILASGGLCRIRNQYVILLNARSSAKHKVQTLAKALKRFDTGPFYIKPAVRELLDGP